jgi:hypothetical protein
VRSHILAAVIGKPTISSGGGGGSLIWTQVGNFTAPYDYVSLLASSDGTKLFVVTYSNAAQTNAVINFSSNSGNTFSTIAFPSAIKGASSLFKASKDLSVIYCQDYSFNRIWKSTNYGNTWTAITNNNGGSSGFLPACSDNGQFLSFSTGAIIQTSSNYGASSVTCSIFKYYTEMSGDGSVIFATWLGSSSGSNITHQISGTTATLVANSNFFMDYNFNYAGTIAVGFNTNEFKVFSYSSATHTLTDLGIGAASSGGVAWCNYFTWGFSANCQRIVLAYHSAEGVLIFNSSTAVKLSTVNAAYSYNIPAICDSANCVYIAATDMKIYRLNF